MTILKIFKIKGLCTVVFNQFELEIPFSKYNLVVNLSEYENFPISVFDFNFKYC